MSFMNVVAAVIKKENLYLIAQRNRNKYFGCKWEFPGGKVENNEKLQDALKREIFLWTKKFFLHQFDLVDSDNKILPLI